MPRSPLPRRARGTWGSLATLCVAGWFALASPALAQHAGSYHPSDAPPPPGGGSPYTPGDTLPHHPVWILAPTTAEILQGAPGILGPMELQPGGPFSLPPWQRGRRPRVSRARDVVVTGSRAAAGGFPGPFDDWQIWWELHRRSLLDRGWTRQAPTSDPPARFFLGAGSWGRSGAPRGPSRTLVREWIVPALREVVLAGPAPARDPALLALAAAAHAGGDAAPQSLAPVLVSMLHEDNPTALLDPPVGAVIGLGMLGKGPAGPDLLARVEDRGEHPFLRSHALLGLAWSGDDETVGSSLDWLGPLSRNVHPSMTEVAVTALGLRGANVEAEILLPLRRVLGGAAVPSLRHAAAMALGHIGGAVPRSLLLRELRCTGPRDRLPWIALALGLDSWVHEAPNPQAAGFLRETLDGESDPFVRGALAIALGLCGGGMAWDALLAIVRDGSTVPWVRREAATSLGRIDTREGVREILAALDETRGEGGRSALLQALGRVAGEEAVGTLLESLTAGEARVVETVRAVAGMLP